jgi:AcrR family transcriptional regulator
MARLDREQVVSAAMALADEAGLDAVSLRRVADRLGVTPMALYRHVASKDDLLDAMADRLYGELDLPADDEPWWDALAGLARSTRETVLARPWSVPLFARPLTGPHGHALDEALRTALLGAGFTPSEAAELHDQLSGMTFALVAPELAARPNRAAFERGLELLHDGLEARLRRS